MIKITSQMRRMVRDVDYANIVAQMVAAEDAMREYENRHKLPPVDHRKPVRLRKASVEHSWDAALTALVADDE